MYRQYLADALTPVAVFRRLLRSKYAFLLESVTGREEVARYSFLGAEPFLIYESQGDRVKIDGRSHPEITDPFEGLRRVLKLYTPAEVEGLPRFTGGAVGYFGYDTVRFVEKLPPAPPDKLRLPDAVFALYHTMVIFDRRDNTVKVVAHALPGRDDPEDAYKEALRRIERFAAHLKAATAMPLVPIARAALPEAAAESNMTRARYMKNVETAREHIRAGDIFQVVLSQRFTRRTTAAPFAIYRHLRALNPSPYMFHLKMDRFHLVGSSPEVMVRLEDGKLTLRPIAGTRRRGRTPADDERLAKELLADPKERAEHVMLVDLGRNDLGRVAEPKTVKVTEVMTLELYSHVMHLTSNITAKLRKGLTAFDALKACLPAGTVSGAPKVRAMEIINDLEPDRRGPYAGAVGYIDFSGNMDTAIAIRTLVCQKGRVHIQTGAGIVADSVPEREHLETRNKARALLAAVYLAENS
ncbi:MAG: anthranilate synthase component I [Planctomycetota bacterium]